MNVSKVIRYSAYILLAIMVVWFINLLFVTFYSIKIDIAKNDFENSLKVQDERRAKDSLIEVNVRHLITNRQYNAAIVKLEAKVRAEEAYESPLDIIEIGDIYQMQGNIDAACGQYTIVIQMDSSDADARMRRGLIYAKQNKLDSAIVDYKVVADFNWDYYYYLGELQERKHDFKHAKASLDSFLKHHPDNPIGRLKLDSIKSEMKKQLNNYVP